MKRAFIKNNKQWKKINEWAYEENKSYKKQEVCYIYQREFNTDKNDESAFKLYHKARDHFHDTGKHRGAAHNICNLRYKILKEIPVVFHNGSTYD